MKKSPIKRKRVKKKSKTRYDHHCMELAKKIVHIRDNDICWKCKKKVFGSNCHCSHILADGSNTRLSVDPENIMILCYHCHIYRRHKEPLEVSKRFIEQFLDLYERLMEKERNTESGSISLTWWEETYEKLLVQYNAIKDEND